MHPLKKRDEHFRLLPKERDHDSYVSFVTGNCEPTGRLAEALAYFKAKLTAPAGGDSTSLRALFNTITQRLEFMCATLEAENAYNIWRVPSSRLLSAGRSRALVVFEPRLHELVEFLHLFVGVGFWRAVFQPTEHVSFD